MKRILITGRNSYLGNAIEQYLAEYNRERGEECYHVDKLSLREDTWKEHSFEGYDTILHVAGLAHADVENVPKETQELYYRVNCEMTLEVAEKAREDGVLQFIYFSSVIVYGDGGGLGRVKNITADTEPHPVSFYGDSKWQAELGLQKLAGEGGEQLKIAILRLPMIYGRDSRGNFPVLIRLAEKLPIFPAFVNQRSMLYVENLAEFVRLLTESGKGGLFFPQNEEYVTTARMVQSIAGAKGRKILLCSVLNPLVYLAGYVPGKIGRLVNKAFGSLTIDRGLTEATAGELGAFCRYDLETGIKRSVT